MTMQHLRQPQGDWAGLDRQREPQPMSCPHSCHSPEETKIAIVGMSAPSV